MKKILVLLIIFVMFPSINVLAVDTPNTDSGKKIMDSNTNTDLLRKKYNDFINMDQEDWIDKSDNKDLYGHNNEDGEFELTGLMNDLFFNINDMLPGDSLTKYIRISNSSDKNYTLSYDAYRLDEQMPKEGEIDLLDVIDLEITKTSDIDGEINQELVYKGKIFDENTNKDVIELGTISVGQEPVIFKATVTMEQNAGEEYKNKQAEISWIFRADGDDDEPTKPDNPTNPTNPMNPSNPNNPVNSNNKVDDGKTNISNKSPTLSPGNNSNIKTVDLNNYKGNSKYNGKGNVSKTGDSNYLAIYFLLALGSFMISYRLFSKRNKNRKEQ